MSISDALARYRPIIDDWPAFTEALGRPLPTCLAVNTLRTSQESLGARLDAAGVALRPVGWYPDAFHAPEETTPGTRLEYLTGRYFVQEEASLVPVALLDPQPGERVLDLCAAPGSKTLLIAARMQGQGTLIANDRDPRRLRALRGNLERAGVLHATTSVYDAANYPSESGGFDRILVDPSCSCEGTSRKNPGVLRQAGVAYSHRLQGGQIAMLRKALQLCRPGGRIVYSTCTYAPEENEAVVDAVLREAGDEVRLLPARLPGLRSAPGLTAWGDQPFDPSLARTLRLWPHLNDTGGFFVAVLEKSASGAPAPERVPADIATLAPADVPEVRTVAARFDFPEGLFAPFRCHYRGNKYVAATRHPHAPAARPAEQTTGLGLIRITLRYPKLTTAGALAFGHHARRNLIDLTAEQISAYLSRGDFTLTPEQALACTGLGYVLVRYEGMVLGTALFFPEGAAGRAKSLYPKAWRR